MRKKQPFWLLCGGVLLVLGCLVFILSPATPIVNIEPEKPISKIAKVESPTPIVIPVTAPPPLPPVFMGTAMGLIWLVQGNPVPSCKVPCYFSREASSNLKPLEEMDAVFYNDLDSVRAFHNSSKVNIFFHSESSALYPHFNNVNYSFH